MDASSTRKYVVAATFLLAACGGRGEETAEATEAEGTPVPEMTAASGGLEGCYLARGTMEEAQARPSPLTEVGLVYEGGAGLICYGAPSANGREIMGGLVPWGAPWRVGANEPTTVHLTAPASIGGVAVDPGSYSIYAVPGETEWEFFINSSYERWGIPINDEVMATDVGSFTATPEATDGMVEQLSVRYDVNDENTMGDIVMEWENTRVSFHLHPGSM